MKTIKTIALALVVALGSLSATAQNVSKKVDVAKSKATWKGYKVTGSHEGTVALSEGALIFNGEKLVGGNFTVNMTTINSTDMTGEYKDKLDGHLKADDFFGVEKFPTASFVITKVAGNQVTGNLTVKGITKSITFPAEIAVKGGKVTAKATITIDRTDFNIRYGSKKFFESIGDKAIFDDFALTVSLVSE